MKSRLLAAVLHTQEEEWVGLGVEDTEYSCVFKTVGAVRVWRSLGSCSVFSGAAKPGRDRTFQGTLRNGKRNGPRLWSCVTLRTLLLVLIPMSALKAGGTCLPAGGTHLWHANSSLAGDWRLHNQSPHWQTGMLPLGCVRLCLGSRVNDPVYLVCNRTPTETAQGRKALSSAFRGHSGTKCMTLLHLEYVAEVPQVLSDHGAETEPEPDSSLQVYSQRPTFARWATVSEVLQLPQTVPPARDQVFKPSVQTHEPVDIAYSNHGTPHLDKGWLLDSLLPCFPFLVASF